MNENKYTKNLRATVVHQIQIDSSTPRDLLHPHIGLFPTPEVSLEQAKEKIWTVILTIKTGFDQKNTQFFYFGDHAAAVKMMEENPIGKVLDTGAKLYPLDFKTIFGDGPANPLGFFRAPHDDFFLCFDVMDGAGFRSQSHGCAQSIRDWHGPEKLSWLEETFGQNWTCVAELEYCINHFSTTSMVVVACKALYNYYVEEDDYSAGYYCRELQLMHGGAEQLADGSVKAREKAGKGGSKASQAARTKRLKQFMSEIEALADLFPRISERAILDQAFLNAVNSDEESWKQGRGQQEQYETELRSDADYRTRYFNIFSKTA